MFLCLVVLGVGCKTANLTEIRGGSAYAPVNERSGGKIEYRSTGSLRDDQERRENAYQQMYQQCGGAYRIVTEADETGGAVTARVSHSVATTSFRHTRVIDFECIDASEAGAQATVASSHETQTGRPEEPTPDVEQARAVIGKNMACEAQNVVVTRTAKLDDNSIAYWGSACNQSFECIAGPGRITCQ